MYTYLIFYNYTGCTDMLPIDASPDGYGTNWAEEWDECFRPVQWKKFARNGLHKNTPASNIEGTISDTDFYMKLELAS